MVRVGDRGGKGERSSAGQPEDGVLVEAEVGRHRSGVSSCAQQAQLGGRCRPAIPGTIHRHQSHPG